MPRYLFYCPNCNPDGEDQDNIWETEASHEEVSDLDLECPFCYTKMNRKYSLLGIQFNGDGFTRKGLK